MGNKCLRQTLVVTSEEMLHIWDAPDCVRQILVLVEKCLSNQYNIDAQSRRNINLLHAKLKCVVMSQSAHASIPMSTTSTSPKNKKPEHTSSPKHQNSVCGGGSDDNDNEDNDALGLSNRPDTPTPAFLMPSPKPPA